MNNCDNTLLKLWVTTRHSTSGGVTVWIVLHSARRSVPPMMRENLKYLFIYRIESAELLEETIYKEFLSLKYRKQGKKFQDFVEDFEEVMEREEYGVILVARKKGVDFNTNKWNFINGQKTKKNKNDQDIQEEEPQKTNSNPLQIPDKKEEKRTVNILSKLLFNKK